MPARSRKLLDFILLHDAQHGQRAGVVPVVVEQSDLCILCIAFLRCDTYKLVQALIAQGRVRTQRHHEIKLACIAQNLDQRAE